MKDDIQSIELRRKEFIRKMVEKGDIGRPGLNYRDACREKDNGGNTALKKFKVTFTYSDETVVHAESEEEAEDMVGESLHDNFDPSDGKFKVKLIGKSTAEEPQFGDVVD